MAKVDILANEILQFGSGGLEVIHIHQFANDEEAHDDAKLDKLYGEFVVEFECALATLSEKYGKPTRVGTGGDEVIPVCGVFRFAVWSVGNLQLFAAITHEDRGTPILLMLGTADGD